MKISREVKIGVVGIITIALFLWGLNFLKGKNVFKSAKYYYAVYDDIIGLKDAHSVYLRGFKVGQVSDILIMKDSARSIIVEFFIEEDLDIPLNSVIKIVPDGFMGVMALDLLLSNNDTILKSGDTLTSAIETSIMDQLAPIKNKVDTAISTIDSVLGAVNSILDAETQKNLKESIKNLKDFSASLNDNNSKFNKMLANIESITSNIKNHNEEISKIISNLSDVSDSLAQADIKQTIDKSYEALAQTQEIVDKINRGEGSIGMLINNDTLYNNIESASLNLDKLLIDLREHPKKYVHFSIFGRKETSK
ncbi:MAG: MCE family protein [Bacteroidales bacterium]|nr:MCE family protein [Bacteroidales bacterium]